MQTVILAGGLATRLHPATLTVPKSMVDVGGKPFFGGVVVQPSPHTPAQLSRLSAQERQWEESGYPPNVKSWLLTWVLSKSTVCAPDQPPSASR